MLSGVPLTDATESVALLGPTNTGKTHRAVERMLEHDSGMIGLPLRLLAREIYDRLSARLGEERLALVTGEEKRIPRRPDYWICTTEAMPLTREVDFVAVDEVQLATHDERGHVFTDRLLHARGRRETWFLGAATMREVLRELVPAARQREHPRFSKLTFSGAAKLSRLPKRSAVVAFSLAELYTVAGQLRQIHGGTAVVMGALSPRARNAQVALFQSGEVDYLVATDAIGMGLNLDIDHVAFAALRKFDGKKPRSLEDAEIGQIAGRAGRYTRNGSFGTLLPLELGRERAERIEAQHFERVRRVRYRNSELDFSSLASLSESLRVPSRKGICASMSDADDLRALETLSRRPDVLARVRNPADVERLWQVCQIPDFRKILFEVHVDLLQHVFELVSAGPIPSAYLRARANELDRTDGDADELMARISRLRTWAFVANQSSWGAAAESREELAALEDRLSDALHAALVLRFVENRGHGRGARHARPRLVTIEDTSDDETYGFRPFAQLSALRARLAPAASPESSAADGTDLSELVSAQHEAFTLGGDGTIRSRDIVLARLSPGTSLVLPEVRLLDLEAGAGLRSALQRRLLAFARDVPNRLLAPVLDLKRSPHGGLRAVAYQLEQGLGTALVSELRATLAHLEPDALDALARLGVRVGRVCVGLSALLRPEALEKRAILVRAHDPKSTLPPVLGRASYPHGALSPSSWLALGYVPLGPRVLRCDLAERAALAQSEGDVLHVLGSLGVPRGERPRVAWALETLSAA
jgi:ATP-dependent RNA helicase SUPV3L1/SUV3